jgi:hemolysin activation/secretion protein
MSALLPLGRRMITALILAWGLALVSLPLRTAAAEPDPQSAGVTNAPAGAQREDNAAQQRARDALRNETSVPPAQVPPPAIAPTAPPTAAGAAAGAAAAGTQSGATAADTAAQAKARQALHTETGLTNQPTATGAGTNAAAENEPSFYTIPKINGIVIASLKDFNPDGVPLKPGLTVEGFPLLEKSEFAKLVDRFIGHPLTKNAMGELQREIILYYRSHDRPLVDVLYKEQDVSNGMLQITVIEGKLKALKIQDAQGNTYSNGWTGVDYIEKNVHLQTNEVISESQIVKDMDWLNRNPFRHVEAVYEPDSREYGMSSLLLRVDEQRQWSADFGYEDSGSRATSEDRLIAGATWGKAFGLVDNQLRYAYTFDPTMEFLRAHSGSYYAPLPWRHGLRLSGYYLNVKGDAGAGSTIEGVSWQTSMRYEVPLPAIGKYQHEASLGLDFKSNENNLLFNSTSVQNTPTEIFQIAFGYSSVLPDKWGQTSFNAQGYYSPGDVTPLNNDTAFNLARPGAKAEYAYARFNAERATRLPYDFSWVLRGMAQIADANLLPSEQLGMGGYATVRGYDEREASGDQGFFMSNEIRTPAISVLRYISSKLNVDDHLQFLGFWDYGQVSNLHLQVGEDPHVLLNSVGAGLRFSISRHFSLRYDYGWQLVDTGLHSPYNSRSHLGVVATY